METSCKKIASQNIKVTEHSVKVTYIMGFGCGILIPNVIMDSRMLQNWLNMMTRTSPAALTNGFVNNMENADASAMVTSYVVSE